MAAITPLSILPELKVIGPRQGMMELPGVEIALYGPRGLVSPATQAVKASVMEALSAHRPEAVAA
jgi:hypothetical protein